MYCSKFKYKRNYKLASLCVFGKTHSVWCYKIKENKCFSLNILNSMDFNITIQLVVTNVNNYNSGHLLIIQGLVNKTNCFINKA